jgi:hypothetical protein
MGGYQSIEDSRQVMRAWLSIELEASEFLFRWWGRKATAVALSKHVHGLHRALWNHPSIYRLRRYRSQITKFFFQPDSIVITANYLTKVELAAPEEEPQYPPTLPTPSASSPVRIPSNGGDGTCWGTGCPGQRARKRPLQRQSRTPTGWAGCCSSCLGQR